MTGDAAGRVGGGWFVVAHAALRVNRGSAKRRSIVRASKKNGAARLEIHVGGDVSHGFL